MGDKAIRQLGNTIAQSVCKSDYAIRQGGDEFTMILIGADLQKAQEVIQRITDNIIDYDRRYPLAFSWGCYQMQTFDTLETAQLIADRHLYLHKQGKYSAEKRPESALTLEQ